MRRDQTRPARPRASRAIAVGAVVAVVAVLGGCSGPPEDQNAELSGCLAGDRGTLALGVTNSAGEPLAITGIELAESEGVEVVDRFVAIDPEARATPVLFDAAPSGTSGRSAFDGVDLTDASIEPDAAAYVGIEVERTGPAEGVVNGVVITTEERETIAPVSLELRDYCG
ncbi:hypothetical protein [Microcella alkalica]|uniref:Uncharacterized protein n=1 Tax=Microcella alkalica TaxID=355930 RepID=A0A839E8Y6_9MICO|nr:hypothetical protein [Microcella alkalica]MBA8847947.1 hypothetical protein [Microcella alkalica]